jgi:hypothetical protein
MSLWNDNWLCLVHVAGGSAEGNKYYFVNKKEAESFRRSIVMEKDVTACYVVKNSDREVEE